MGMLPTLANGFQKLAINVKAYKNGISKTPIVFKIRLLEENQRSFISTK
jgi:hypothetical protein